jgi:hypothetical protein
VQTVCRSVAHLQVRPGHPVVVLGRMFVSNMEHLPHEPRRAPVHEPFNNSRAAVLRHARGPELTPTAETADTRPQSRTIEWIRERESQRKGERVRESVCVCERERERERESTRARARERSSARGGPASDGKAGKVGKVSKADSVPVADPTARNIVLLNEDEVGMPAGKLVAQNKKNKWLSAHAVSIGCGRKIISTQPMPGEPGSNT